MKPIPKKYFAREINRLEREIYKKTGRRIVLKPFENKIQMRITNAVRLKDVEHDMMLQDLILKFCECVGIDKYELITKERKTQNCMLRYAYVYLVYNIIPELKLKLLQQQLMLNDHTSVMYMKRTADSLFFTKYEPFMNIYNKVKPLYEHQQEI